MDGKPITTFLIVALILWGIYLWRQGRLGQVQMLPHPGQVAASLKPGPQFVGPPLPPGWQSLPARTPGVTP